MEPKEFFDIIASKFDDKYDADKSLFLHHFFEHRINVALDGAKLDGANVLDVGAGTGRLYKSIMNRFAINDYFAVDIS